MSAAGAVAIATLPRPAAARSNSDTDTAATGSATAFAAALRDAGEAVEDGREFPDVSPTGDAAVEQATAAGAAANAAAPNAPAPDLPLTVQLPATPARTSVGMPVDAASSAATASSEAEAPAAAPVAAPTMAAALDDSAAAPLAAPSPSISSTVAAATDARPAIPTGSPIAAAASTAGSPRAPHRDADESHAAAPRADVDPAPTAPSDRGRRASIGAEASAAVPTGATTTRPAPSVDAAMPAEGSRTGLPPAPAALAPTPLADDAVPVPIAAPIAAAGDRAAVQSPAHTVRTGVADAFAAQLSKPVVALAQGPTGVQHVTVQVTPEHLGPVSVRAAVSPEGVRIELLAPGETGREALRQVLGDLRRDLVAAGLTATLDVSPRDAGAGTTGQPPARDESAEPDPAPVHRETREEPPRRQQRWSPASDLDVIA